jgi:hypothetical protein
VTAVTPAEGDLDIASYVLVPNPAYRGQPFVGDHVGTLASNRVTGDVDPLVLVCGTPGRNYQLALGLRAGATSTYATGLTIHYSSGGSEHTLVLLDNVVLCVDRSDAVCAPA